jgi:protein-L-isoaspartate(D-aspartate) O-methyltransferase
MQTATASEQMIEQQVRAWEVLDARVLEAMRKAPRELFVPQSQRHRAYTDAEVPLAHGQHMLRPSVAGRVLQALLPQPSEKVLEIGAGSGYVTACLALLATRVSSVELYPDLAESARANLASLGVRNAEVLAVGGRLFIVVGEAPAMDARLVTRTGADTWRTQSLFETVIDPLVNSVRPQEFTF